MPGYALAQNSPGCSNQCGSCEVSETVHRGLARLSTPCSVRLTPEGAAMAFARPHQAKAGDENAVEVKEQKGAGGFGKAVQPTENNRRQAASPVCPNLSLCAGLGLHGSMTVRPVINLLL